ncbi:hypothetical protein FA10DRAFT_265381 [Acaromyces ingoldii]|uniref:Brain protein I3 n=1 Tax=Acaromyces ingoldii TaxID=215250 RepID=A0A316YQX8_9BASI|nr:hypothetical protein FA10DRAFT_265381 [Acaromyces ingoldii]PWN91532.1 hypothetical protein FA10DRAFT_265381 [Acaromyces ingoldii]
MSEKHPQSSTPVPAYDAPHQWTQSPAGTLPAGGAGLHQPAHEMRYAQPGGTPATSPGQQPHLHGGGGGSTHAGIGSVGAQAPFGQQAGIGGAAYGLSEGAAYQQQLMAQCARGNHSYDTKFGVVGIIVAVCCFPCGLIALCIDKKEVCTRCGHQTG